MADGGAHTRGAGQVGSAESHVLAARVRVMVIVALVCGGFVAARVLWGACVPVASWGWFVACMLAVAGCAAAKQDGRWAWAARVCGSAAVLTFAAGVFTVRAVETPRDRVDQLVADGSVVTLEGRADDEPAPVRVPATVLGRFERRQASGTFVLWVRRVRGDGDWRAASGDVRVFVRGSDFGGVRAGDVVCVTGEFRAEESSGNPGDEDAVLWSNQSARAGALEVTGAALFAPGDTRAWDRVWGAVLRGRAALRARAQQVVERAAGEGDAARRALFESLMLGRTGVGIEAGQVSGLFTRLGMLHVLSISGFHLTVMAALALWLLRLTGDRGRLEPIALAAIVIAYMAIVPASSPILRSGAMVLSLLAVEASGRRYDRLCVLGWIAVALLLWRPMDLWSLGFELSLGLTALLLSAGGRFTEGMFTPVLKGLVGDATLAQRVKRGLRTAFAVSVMCWVVSLPSIMHVTGLVSPAAVAAGLIISPIIVVLLWVGYGALLLGVFVPGAGGAAAWAVERLGGLALWVSGWLDALPFSSLRVPIVPGWWALLATGVGVVWAHKLQWGRWKWACVWAITVSMLLAVWAADPGVEPGTAVRVDALNVGDGTCLLVRSGRGVTMWDCKGAQGGRGSLPGVVDAARALGVWRVPRVVVTHPDLDHFGGLPEIVEPLGVEEVVVPQRFLDVAASDPRGAPAALLRNLESQHVQVCAAGAGDQVSIGAATMRFVWPDAHAAAVAGDRDNDYSLVAIVEHGGARVLLTGDVQQGAIGALRGTIPPVSAMELPHHGAYSTACEEWVRELAPQAVVQSTGPGRLGDARWNAAKQGVNSWRVTAGSGWWGVIVAEDGGVQTVPMRR